MKSTLKKMENCVKVKIYKKTYKQKTIMKTKLIIILVLLLVTSTKESWSQTIIDNQEIDKIQYIGNWKTNETGSISNSIGDEIKLNFKGKKFSIIGGYNSNLGIAEVYLDGKKIGIIDQYEDRANSIDEVFYWDDLEDKEHELVIKIVGKNKDSSNSYIVISKIKINYNKVSYMRPKE